MKSLKNGKFANDAFLPMLTRNRVQRVEFTLDMVRLFKMIRVTNFLKKYLFRVGIILVVTNKNQPIYTNTFNKINVKI